MRPGLVAVGAAFALLGAGVLASVLLPTSSPTVERTGSVAVDQLAPGPGRLFTLPGTVTSSASLSLRWIASAPVAVSWYLTVRCTAPAGWCIETTPIVQWYSETAGNWSSSGSAISLYGLWVQTTTNVTVDFTANFLEQYLPAPLLLLPLPLAVVLAGGSLLIGLGGVAIYLGLFLPSGVFSGLRGLPDVIYDTDGPIPSEAFRDEGEASEGPPPKDGIGPGDGER